MFFINFENKQAAFVEQNLKWYRLNENFKRLKTVIGISIDRGAETKCFQIINDNGELQHYLHYILPSI